VRRSSLSYQHLERLFPIRLIALVGALFILRLAGIAQSLVFHNYSTNDGLLATNVSQLMQDQQGFIWVVSTEGIQKFDGTSFTSYVGKNLPYTTVYDIDQDVEGDIWAASLGGLLKLTNGSFARVWPSKIDSTIYLHSLLAASDGSIWFAGNPGLLRMKNGATERLAFTPSFMDGTIIVEAADHNVWINRGDRVWIYSLNQNSLVFPEFRMAKGAVPQFILPDKDSTAWVLTGDGALLRYRDTTLLGLRRSVGSKEALFLVDDGENNLWIGGWDGLIRIPKENFELSNSQLYNEKNGLPQNLVLCGLRDREGNLWFGTNSEGLAKLSDQHTYSFPLPFQFRANNNMDAVADPQNHIWINSQNAGLEEIFRERGTWYRFNHKLSSGEAVPRAIVCDTKGRLWVSHVDGNLICYAVQHQQGHRSRLIEIARMIPKRDLPNGEPYAMTIDSSGNLFLSILRYGVVVIETERMKVVHAFDRKIPNIESIRAIEVDRDGGVWMGDFSHGLTVITDWRSRNVDVRHFTTEDGLPNDGIRALLEASDGAMWIGTRYGGIAVFDGKHFRTIGMENGMRSNAIWCLAEDHQERMWFGSTVAIESIDMKTLMPLPLKPELSHSGTGACGTLPGNIMWGVSHSELLIHEDSGSEQNLRPPPVYLKDIFVNQTPILETSAQLSSTQNNLHLSYVGISFRDEKAVRYRTRLLGLEEEWREPTKLGEVTYASLSPGSYRFEVKAINADGIESSTPASFDFTVAPPFWKTWWFFFLSSLTIIGLVTLVVRARVRRLLEVERIRTHIATDLHDDIGSGLTRIAVLSDVAARKAVGEPGSVLPIVEKMGTSARELHDAMGDVIWSIDPVHDSLESVVGRLKVFAHEVCEGSEIELEFSEEDALVSVKLNPQSLRSLLLIGKEALTNAVTHSHCTKVTVRIVVDGHWIFLSIIDNGKGFLAGREGGNGLTNMKRRATKSGGNFSISSDEGKGTIVEARIPSRP